MSKSWGDDFEPDSPELDDVRAIPNTPAPMAPVRDLDESGPADDCPLCAQRCFCGHTLARPWSSGDDVRCHNCGALNKPRPPAMVPPQPHFEDGFVGE